MIRSVIVAVVQKIFPSMRPTGKKFEIHFCDKAECKQYVTDTVTQIYEYANRDIPLEFKFESCISELIDPNEYIKRPGVIEDIAHTQECCMKMRGKIPGFQLTKKNSSLFMVVVSAISLLKCKKKIEKIFLFKF